MKTKEEIDELKRDWLRDPIWDIYRTEGFEGHEAELEEYQNQIGREWQEKESARVRLKCQELSCSPELLNYIGRMEYKISLLESGND